MPGLIKREKLPAGVPVEVIDIPDLVEIQTDSYRQFLEEGLPEELKNISNIEGFGGRFQLEFLEGYTLEEPEYAYDECLRRELTFSRRLKVPVRLHDRETGEVREQVIFMGDLPIMTDRGTFLINGAERVIVSQFVRSPGVYYRRKVDKAGKNTFFATLIPNRGAWLDFETDANDILYGRINKVRKLPVTIIYGALGSTEQDIFNQFKHKEFIRKTWDKAPFASPEEALLELNRRLRPGEPATLEGAQKLIHGLFFDSKRYDLGRVGRYKLNAKLGLDVPENVFVLTRDDFFGVGRYLVELCLGNGYTDDIDHLGNRRIRSIGELLQKQFRVGLTRMERLIKEQMALVKTSDNVMPQHLINIRPLTAAIREFFCSSQLSQFMGQTNPLAELAHKRRLSALGPGGLTRERAGFEVRDIHPSHYGRICPIETPEGPNAGLIGPLATYAKVNKYGFVETPYRVVKEGRVTDEVVFLTADAEDQFRIASWDVPMDPRGRITSEQVPVRYQREFVMALPEEINYVGVSPRQIVGITTALIPFMEHDDANRALMGANMQRQSTPLLRPQTPYVGTGLEKKIAEDSGSVIRAKAAGKVVRVTGEEIVVQRDRNEKDVYKLIKYQRSNQGTCISHRAIVSEKQEVKQGQALADNTSTQQGELALGRNILVAFMPWEGYNFEDAIIINERLVKEDYFTSIHINKYEMEVRSTKLGPEELTREIPNVSEETIRHLDDQGIVQVGSEVKAGDVLVGKITPKGETEPPAEEKLLRAIFGERAREMRDTSLRVPPGESGKVIEVRHFSRARGDELAPGVNEVVRIYVGQLRKVSIGDKLTGRHGNKGVISQVLPEEDMPFLPDGTPVDVILNPLGVPSRMNVGQTYETLLGMAGKILGEYYEVTAFDEYIEEEASVRVVKDKLKEAGKVKGYDWLSASGKVRLRDGRSGEYFDRPVTVGYIYIMKLIHLVEDKIHARSTGPYSLVTQQPLGGKAQFGGQRFGEMEVWALEAYGAAHTLQEMLTVKSDDVSGRAKAYEAIIKGKTLSKPGVPESFRVMLRELRSLGLNVRVFSRDGIEIEKR